MWFTGSSGCSIFSFLRGDELDGMPPWNNVMTIKLGDLQIASTSKQI